ncbi:hypothetical protein, partial [Desulfobulbus alkaliphilus]|uniref:hypothetical protein n=1 Tax=Desulfobulbus alkaliphilus TaxID=869814 RepID=UPI0019663117
QTLQFYFPANHNQNMIGLIYFSSSINILNRPALLLFSFQRSRPSLGASAHASRWNASLSRKRSLVNAFFRRPSANPAGHGQANPVPKATERQITGTGTPCQWVLYFSVLSEPVIQAKPKNSG